MKAIKSVDGQTACLIYCADGKYRVRIYHEPKLSMFEDYEIAISDLFFTITDEDAFIYEDDSGRRWLDHSPGTLGVKNE